MKNFVIMMCLGLVACTDEPRARETLQKAGYTEINVGGHDFYSCSEDDNFSTHFSAKNPQGQVVEGTVCCGMMKSCTIRF